jgi:hypothetical protein
VRAGAAVGLAGPVEGSDDDLRCGASHGIRRAFLRL